MLVVGARLVPHFPVTLTFFQWSQCGVDVGFFRERKESQNAPFRHIARDCLHSASSHCQLPNHPRKAPGCEGRHGHQFGWNLVLKTKKWDQSFLWKRAAIQTSCGATSSRDLLLSRRHGQDLLGTVRDGQNITFCLRSC